MSNPNKIWAWYDVEYDVVTGGLEKKSHEPSVEYLRKDTVVLSMVNALKWIADHRSDCFIPNEDWDEAVNIALTEMGVK